MGKQPLSIIADKDAKEAELVQAIRKLGPVSEPASFWADIANNQEYSSAQRRHCVFQLFKRHVKPGMTLSELAQTLDNPTWLEDDDVTVLLDLAGHIPVKWTADNTVVVLSVFPNVPDGRLAHWAIYVSISGHIDQEEFINVIRGRQVAQRIKDAKILQLGFVPEDPTASEK